jgi:hypothetical protein
MNKPKIAIVGCFQNGKSTLVNCLLDDKVAQTGFGLSTTHISTTYVYGETQSVELTKKDGGKKIIRLNKFTSMKPEDKPEEYASAVVTLWKPLLEDVDIIDTPGFNADCADSQMALDSIKEADFVLLLLQNKGLASEGSGGNNKSKELMPQTEMAILELVAKKKIPFSVIVNCRDQGGAMWDPCSQSNDKIITHIESKIKAIGHYPVKIGDRDAWPCNLLWFWRASEHLYSEPDDEIVRVDSGIRSYFSNIEEGVVPSASVLIKRSSFIPVRDFFQKNPWHMISPGSIHCMATLEQTINSWEKELVEVINKAKETLK